MIYEFDDPPVIQHKGDLSEAMERTAAHWDGEPYPLQIDIKQDAKRLEAIESMDLQALDVRVVTPRYYVVWSVKAQGTGPTFPLLHRSEEQLQADREAIRRMNRALQVCHPQSVSPALHPTALPSSPPSTAHNTVEPAKQPTDSAEEAQRNVATTANGEGTD